MSFSVQDQKILQKIEKLFRELDHERALTESYSGQLIEDLQRELRLLATHSKTEIAKLARIADHLHPKMEARVLMDFLVPIERALDRNLRDDDFLIRDRDAKKTFERNPFPLHLVLDHWRSSFNVGSVFRSADGLGIEKIHLTGYTPTPKSSAKTAKSALGAEELVPWQHHPRTETALEQLKTQGYRLIALETADHAHPLQEPYHPGPTAFVLGNERFGLRREILNLCDEVRILPLHGTKNSLNAAVVAALASYEWIRQCT